jgi:hypothetical protein
MSRVHDELEERRVIRLLDGAAADVPELGAAEIARLLEGARRRRHATRRVGVAHRVRVLAPAAAAAALAAVALGGLSIPGSASRDERAPTTTHGALVFPEASALELLLAHRRSGAA